MKLIIDISEEEYKMRMLWAKSDSLCSPDTILIAKGVPYEERPQGEWITENIEKPYGKCNLCGEICEVDNYCGSCGAQMKGGAE